MKVVRTRWRLYALYAGGMLLTWGACFMVTVEPDYVALWRLKDDDEDLVAYKHYADNKYPADDMHYDDHDFCYNDNDFSEQVPV